MAGCAIIHGFSPKYFFVVVIIVQSQIYWADLLAICSNSIGIYLD